jgi:hypothetical protein
MTVLGKLNLAMTKGLSLASLVSILTTGGIICVLVHQLKEAQLAHFPKDHANRHYKNVPTRTDFIKTVLNFAVLFLKTFAAWNHLATFFLYL